MKHTAYGPEEIALAVELRNQGHKLITIAARLGRSPGGMLSRILRDAGCVARVTPSCEAWKQYPPSPIPEIEERIQFYQHRVEQSLSLPGSRREFAAWREMRRREKEAG